jgi:hypothetical protein
MRLALKLHPESICEAVTGIEVELARPGGGRLALIYVVTGRIGELVIPPPAPAERTDGLWQHTCFEAFLSRSEGYQELNFSPSGQWAAYRFDGYRTGIREAEIESPVIRSRAAAETYELEASVTLPDGESDRLGLSAVVEEMNGRKSYWALAHPPGKADFHHPDSFVHRLS